MTGTVPRREALVREALAQSARDVEPLGRGRWRVDLTNGKPFTALARLEDGWLLLEAGPALPDPAGREWEYLLLNGTFRGGSRLTLPPDGGALLLRAEVPAWEDGWVTRVGEACRSLEAAFGRVVSRKPARVGDGEAAGDVEPGRGGEAPGLPQALSEAGWACAEGTGKDVAVPLDVPGALYRAAVEPRAGGEVRIGVEVAAAGTLAPAARRALGRLLLVGTGLVRLVRAAATTNGAGGTARLEVEFPSSPSAAELDLALEALSIACRSFGREARALAREDVASAYLELGAREQETGTRS